MINLKLMKKGYSGYRPDILRLLPVKFESVLDVGCGSGLSGKLLAQRYPGTFVAGIEGDSALAENASAHMDRVVKGDLNNPGAFDALAGRCFDVIIMADVLEHIHECEKLLATAVKHLQPGGVIITSIPNIRHIATFTSLFFKGTWPQNSRGLFDRTHVRFFTRKDILRLFSDLDLEVIKERRNLRIFESCSWSNIPGKLFDFWPLRPFLTFQYLHVVTRKTDMPLDA